MSDVTIDRDNLTYILSLPKGRKLIWELLGVSGFLQNPFNPESDRLTAFASGNKNTAILLFAECMETSPDLTAMMLKEQGNVDNARARNAAKLGGNSVPDYRPDTSGNDPVDPSLDPGDLGFNRSGGRLVPDD